MAEQTPALPERPHMTLEGILSHMEASDLDLADVPVDWRQALGEDLRDKVDAIEYVLALLRHREAFWKERADGPLKRARAAKRNSESLRAYVAETMERHKFQALPGHEHRVQLYDSQPALEILRPATALDFQNFPDFVEPVREYRWRTDTIKAALESGQFASCPFANLTVSKFVKFHPVKPQLPATNKRGKK